MTGQEKEQRREQLLQNFLAGKMDIDIGQAERNDDYNDYAYYVKEIIDNIRSRKGLSLKGTFSKEFLPIKIAFQNLHSRLLALSTKTNTVASHFGKNVPLWKRPHIREQQKEVERRIVAKNLPQQIEQAAQLRVREIFREWTVAEETYVREQLTLRMDKFFTQKYQQLKDIEDHTLQKQQVAALERLANETATTTVKQIFATQQQQIIDKLL